MGTPTMVNKIINVWQCRKLAQLVQGLKQCDNKIAATQVQFTL